MGHRDSAGTPETVHLVEDAVLVPVVDVGGLGATKAVAGGFVCAGGSGGVHGSFEQVVFIDVGEAEHAELFVVAASSVGGLTFGHGGDEGESVVV